MYYHYVHSDYHLCLLNCANLVVRQSLHINTLLWMLMELMFLLHIFAKEVSHLTKR